MKKIVKGIITAICITFLFFGIREMLRYMLIDDTKSYIRVSMHQFYNPKENIDILLVGSSHVYRSLNPEILDEKLGGYTFNAGSSAQLMNGSLALVKEAIKKNDLKKVFVEVYYEIAVNDASDDTKMQVTYFVSDYMKPSINRTTLLVNAGPNEYMINSFILARRYWNNLLEPDKIADLLIKKQSSDYKNYRWPVTPDDKEYYVDRGFVANETEVSENTVWNKKAYNSINLENFSKDWKRDLKEIIKVCHKKGIEVTLFAAPEPNWTIAGVGNYDEYRNLIASIAKEYGVLYYDFNYSKKEYFDTNDKSLFSDEDHLNKKGAEKFSQLFGDFFSGKLSEKEIFYSSLKEKLNDEKVTIYGLAGPINEKDNNMARIISNREEGIEYKITIVPEGKEKYTIQDYSENKSFSLPLDEHGKIIIAWREKRNKNRTNTNDFSY